jgi:4-amino-4-deoxy-L-arabinose transferase-like glycosyltransferase
MPAGGFGGGGFPGPPGGFPPGGMGRRGGPGGPPGFGGGPPGFGGTPGVFRFTGLSVAGQIAWFFPLAIVGSFAAAIGQRWRLPFSPLQIGLVLWAGWFATHLVVFSFAQGIFHDYYTTVMAPAVGALAALGLVPLWRAWGMGGWRRSLLPTTLLVSAGWHCYLMSNYDHLRYTILPATAGAVGLGVALMITSAGLSSLWRRFPWAGVGAGLAVAALFIGPTTWSLAPVVAKGNLGVPTADPSAFSNEPGGRMPFMPPFDSNPGDNDKLVAFLRANRHGEKIFVAAPGSMQVGPIIIHTGEAAVSLGGFMGADPVVTAEEFEAMVQRGEVRFVMLGGGPPGMGGPGRGGPPGAGGGPPGMMGDFAGMMGGPPGGGMGGPPFMGGPPGGFGGPPGGPGGPGGPGNAELMAWVEKHGKAVDAKLWQGKEPEEPALPLFGRMFGGRGGPGGMAKLYDCRPELGVVPAETP